MTAIQKAEKLHKKVGLFFISCVGSDGYPLTKAVLSVPAKQKNSLSEIYFCTNTSSKFVQELSSNPKANVYFYSKEIFIWKGCMLKGNMEIVSDPQVKLRFWDDKYKEAYLPEKSPSCPDYCVLKFTPISGRYYTWYKLEDFEV